MKYDHIKTGRDFEMWVLGCCSEGKKGSKRLSQLTTFFWKDLKGLLSKERRKHPRTIPAACLYGQIARKLERLRSGLSCGMKIVPTVNTVGDMYGVDFFVLVPLLSSYVVTVDLFVYDGELLSLKEEWIANFPGHYFSNEDYHNHLYALKETVKAALENRDVNEPLFRYENHCIMVPSDFSTYESRRRFAGFIVDYFEKVFKEEKRKKAQEAKEA
jgi:hypothetical protein